MRSCAACRRGGAERDAAGAGVESTAGTLCEGQGDTAPGANAAAARVGARRLPGVSGGRRAPRRRAR